MKVTDSVLCVCGLVGWFCKFDLFLFVKWILKSAEGGKVFSKSVNFNNSCAQAFRNLYWSQRSKNSNMQGWQMCRKNAFFMQNKPGCFVYFLD